MNTPWESWEFWGGEGITFKKEKRWALESILVQARQGTGLRFLDDDDWEPEKLPQMLSVTDSGRFSFAATQQELSR